VTGTIPSVRCGHPEPRFVSTSHVERLNLSVRVHLRRFVRRTNAHSRKLANHKACVALWVAWYNFVRVNTSVRMTALYGGWNHDLDLDYAGFADMFLEVLKGLAIVFGGIVMVIFGVILWVSPNPIATIARIWRSFWYIGTRN